MKTAVILVNLGTPTHPTRKAVRRFLKAFLSDRRVIEVPQWIRYLLLNAVILPFRIGKVTQLYQALWEQAGGSPIRMITQRQAVLLQQALEHDYPDNTPLVTHAMSHSDPRLVDVVTELKKQGIEYFLILPLYPQYSATTTGSVYDQLAHMVLQSRNVSSLNVIKDYHNNPYYIKALANSVRRHWCNHAKPDRLLMSFHGIPMRCVDRGDPYYRQCQTTARLLAEHLLLSDDQWGISFQSRLGRMPWLSPYTDELLQQWAEKGIKRVDVICPAFSSDCLETLEEIDQQNRQLFLDAGGQVFHYIPCLNTQSEHIDTMLSLVRQYLPDFS